MIRVRNVLFDRKKMLVGDKTLQIEIASTPPQRALGFSFRDFIPEDYGMLFVYEEPKILEFWMKNTRIPLDIAFISEAGEIKEIYALNVGDINLVKNKEPAKYALEVNQGWFKKNNITLGHAISATL
jgi:uncharacterized membrane protein (UPF0127 family)